MLISYKWLSQYLPEKIDIETLSNILTDIGLEVEGLQAIEQIPGSMEGFKIGEVLTCEQHPNADRLKVTTVNIGEEDPVQIVCGAPNVASGQKVVVATVGSKIYAEGHEPFTIKKAKLRGEASHGMICSGKEINWNDDDSGILVLPEDAEVGKTAAAYFQLEEADIQIEIGLTPNRSDAFSHIGVAKDVVAYWKYHKDDNWEIQWPESKSLDTLSGENSLEIIIENTEKCPYYSGVVLKDIEIKESPKWMQNALKAIGLNPINNVVDITNYVLHEMGHPLHAFDLNAFKTEKIVIKEAVEKEKFTTLDNSKIELHAEDLMITNGNENLAIAGVYGGLDSGVKEDTKSIFLESAYFQAESIRKTSMRHQLRTDAAVHFEKGIPFAQIDKALARAIYLLEKYANAKIASPFLKKAVNTINNMRTISLKRNYLEKLVGKSYDLEKTAALFKHLGFYEVKVQEDSIHVQVHHTNQDMHCAADLVEEVIRIDGLNAIPIPEQIQIPLRPLKPEHSRKEKNKISDILIGQGFFEIMTNSLTNGQNFQDRKDLVPLLNSISKGLDTMRPSILQSGLDVIAYNLNRQLDSLKIFEFGKTYHQPKENIYIEKEVLAFWTSGYEIKNAWNSDNKAMDFYGLKAVVENILSFLPQNLKTKAGEGNSLLWLHKKKEIASLEEVSQKQLKKFGIKQKVYFAEIDWKSFVNLYRNIDITYEAVAKYPKIERDLSLVLEENIPYGKVEDLIQNKMPEMLIDYQLFDLFSGEKLGKNKKALAVKFIFQLKERTLKDKEVDNYMEEIMELFKEKLEAIIRT